MPAASTTFRLRLSAMLLPALTLPRPPTMPQVEQLRWLKRAPTNEDGDFRLYVCADDDGCGRVELCGLSLTSTADGGDTGAALGRHASAPQQPSGLRRQSSEGVRGSAPPEPEPELMRLRSAGRAAAAAAAGLGDAEGFGGSQWLGKADVSLAQLSPRCWWTRLPAPSSLAGFADSPLWASSPPGAPFTGRATLRFALRLGGAELPKAFEVLVDAGAVGAARCSRVVFAVVKADRSMAMLRGEPGAAGQEQRDLGAEEAAQTYRALLGGIWRHFTEPRFDNVDAYTACWEHGLLLAFMLRRGRESFLYCTYACRQLIELSLIAGPCSEQGGAIVASAFRPALAIGALRELLPARWDVSSRIQLWCFVGQAISAAEELHETVKIMIF